MSTLVLRFLCAALLLAPASPWAQAQIAPYGYAGREPDASGLIYSRARYQDPTLGRYTQRDPIGLGGGVNDYGYVGGDPVSVNDPSGLTPDLGPSRSTGGLLGTLFPNFMRSLLSGDLPRPEGMQGQPILTGLGPPDLRGGLLGRLCSTCLDLVLGGPQFAGYDMGALPAPPGGLIVPFRRPFAYITRLRREELDILRNGFQDNASSRIYDLDTPENFMATGLNFERTVRLPTEIAGKSFFSASGMRQAAIAAADESSGYLPQELSTFVINTVESGAWRFYGTLRRAGLNAEEQEMVLYLMREFKFRHKVWIPAPIDPQRILGVVHWNTATRPPQVDWRNFIPNPFPSQ